jgi:hypothetical protein
MIKNHDFKQINPSKYVLHHNKKTRDFTKSPEGAKYISDGHRPSNNQRWASPIEISAIDPFR